MSKDSEEVIQEKRKMSHDAFGQDPVLAVTHDAVKRASQKGSDK